MVLISGEKEHLGELLVFFFFRNLLCTFIFSSAKDAF